MNAETTSPRPANPEGKVCHMANYCDDFGPEQ